MALQPGSRLGVYEITAQLGVGGMGEVYRARDSRLDRQVAIKVLPEALAADPERLARFDREAKTLAALNHPNIAQIHGLEHGAIVMELVEGEDLAQRIARGPIPMDEALPIARQIAEALEAAHAQGIVHRDLKPANIKVRPDGQVKVLDFGLAKAMAPLPKERDFSPADQSPTITSPAMMTGVGMILGTAAYMSPEQAKGREADRRSDIWAFGVVAYEMLTGRRAFDGADMTDVLGAVVRLEPNWTALPADLPLPIRTLLQGCLVKDRGRRVADISTALFVIDQASSLSASPVIASGVLPPEPRSRRLVAPVAAAIATAVVVSAGAWVAMQPAAPVSPRVTRFQLAATGPAALTINVNDRDLAITPDGSKVVYVGNNSTQIFVRALDALTPVAVYTGAPRSPFISPDGQWIGFIDDNRVLSKVAMTGGPAVRLASLETGAPRGATWGSDDTIFVATQALTSGLRRVAATGGTPTVATTPDRAKGELDHLWPERLPGGHAVLFTITAVIGGLDAAQIAVLDLQTGTTRVLVRGGSHAQYVSAIPGDAPKRDERGGGYLVYASAGTLQAVPFDLATLETRGSPVPVVTDVVTTSNGGVDAVMADNGTLAYVSGSASATQQTLVWVDRHGVETPTTAPPRSYIYPRLSPDGARIVTYSADQELDLWIWDLARSTLTRATFNPGADLYPLWTPDGQRLIFTSDRAGSRNLFWQSAAGTGGIERLSESPLVQNATAVSPDGRHLIFTESAEKTADDVMQVALAGTHQVTPLIQTPFVERNGMVSPDGRWLAYEANDSGRLEIYVRPYPEVSTGRYQVSTAGGSRPLWSRSGTELFYVAPSGAIMQLGVERVPVWSASTPAQLIKPGYVMSPGGSNGRNYDIAADGQRFLVVKQGGSDPNAAAPRLIVVQNWTEELKRLVPLK